jgi:hypothetical protein
MQAEPMQTIFSCFSLMIILRSVFRHMDCGTVFQFKVGETLRDESIGKLT